MKSYPPISRPLQSVDHDSESVPQPATKASRRGAILFAGTFFVLLTLLILAEALRG